MTTEQAAATVRLIRYCERLEARITDPTLDDDSREVATNLYKSVHQEIERRVANADEINRTVERALGVRRVDASVSSEEKVA